MSDELKEMLIATAIKNGIATQDDGEILMRAEVRLHFDGISVSVGVDRAAEIIFGKDFWKKQSDLISPVLEQIAQNLDNAAQEAVENKEGV